MINYPILYGADIQPSMSPSTRTEYGLLADCASCVVKEERNGSFELEIVYPLDGVFADKIAIRNLIFCKPSTKRNAQFFRIYKITKTMPNEIVINAAHISYDLSGFVTGIFSGNGAQAAMSALQSHIQPYGTCDFSFYSDIAGSDHFEIYVPYSARAVLGGIDDSMLKVFGGELLFDNFDVHLKSARGDVKNTFITYGFNLSGYELSENSENFITGYKPFWAKQRDDGSYIYRISSPATIYTNGTGVNPYGFEKNIPLDLSNDFDDRPTQTDFTNYAIQKINDIGVLENELTISITYDDLSTAENENVHDLIDLCDTITVRNFKTNRIDPAKIVAIEYDVLRNRYNNVSVGVQNANVAEQIAELQAALNGGDDKSLIKPFKTWTTYDEYVPRVYCSTLGSDTDGNGTKASPYRSIDKCFSVGLKHNDLKIYLMDAGTYDMINTMCLTGMALHISRDPEDTSTAADSDFKINVNKFFRTYMSHVYLAHVAITCAETANMNIYFEGGALYLESVTWEMEFCLRTYGCSALVYRSNIGRIRGFNSQLRFDTLTITNLDKNRDAIYLRNCKLYLDGTITLNALPVSHTSLNYANDAVSTTPTFLRLEGTDFSNGNVTFVNNLSTTKYQRGIALTGASLYNSPARNIAYEAAGSGISYYNRSVKALAPSFDTSLNAATRETGQTPVTSCAAQAVTQFDITFTHAYTPNNCIVGTELYRTSSNRYVGLSTLSRGPLVTDVDGNVIGITCYIANNHTAAQNFRIDWFVIGERAE